MTQPDNIVQRIPVRLFWSGADRPLKELARVSELKGRRLPSGTGFGSPGPDQGYLLKLAEGIGPHITLGSGEGLDDVVAAAVVVGTKRASVFGRAPIKADLLFALTVFGYDSEPTESLLTLRQGLISGVAHSYQRQRELADLIPVEILRLTGSQLEGERNIWEEWFE